MRPLIFTSLFISITVFNIVTAQTVEEQMTKVRPSCNDVFINAVDVFPKLYREKAFDSMHTAINIWKEACGNNDKIIVTTLMLSMQQHAFNKDSISVFTIEVLENYARLFSIKNIRRLIIRTKRSFINSFLYGQSC